jgi:hypothetical protein
VLMGYAESDLEAQAWVTAFVQGFKELGWIVGRNVSEAAPIRQTTRRPDQAWLYCCQAASFCCCCFFCFFVASVEKPAAPA